MVARKDQKLNLCFLLEKEGPSRNHREEPPVPKGGNPGHDPGLVLDPVRYLPYAVALAVVDTPCLCRQEWTRATKEDNFSLKWVGKEVDSGPRSKDGKRPLTRERHVVTSISLPVSVWPARQILSNNSANSEVKVLWTE